MYLGSERYQPQQGEFKMLEAKGYADNGYAENQAYDQVGYGQFPAADNNPDNVQNQSAHPEIARLYVSAKGP